MRRLIGIRFNTWVEALDGVCYVWKSMDLVVPNREPSLCFREFLGYLIGSHLGLTIPETRLFQEKRYGRVSIQRLVTNARIFTTEEKRALAPTKTGVRILLLDLLSCNHDRRLDNILVSGNTIFPIDFNVAFAFEYDRLIYEEFRTIITQWFEIEGILNSKPSDLDFFLLETRRMRALLCDRNLNYIFSLIDSTFMSRDERMRLLKCLKRQRDMIELFLIRWWEETVEPLHLLLETRKVNRLKE